MLYRFIVAILFLSTLSTSTYSQCLGGTIAWVTPPSPPAGTLQATGKILGTVSVFARSQGTFQAGRPVYTTNANTWKGFTFESIRVIRGLSAGAAGNYTYFKLSTPLDSNYFHLRVSDIRGDAIPPFVNNTEHQRVQGFLAGSPVTATFKDPQNGAFITGGNVINGASTTTAPVQSAMRVFFDGAVDSIVVTAVAWSDGIIMDLLARCDIVLPFKLNSFTAKQFDKKIMLSWEAASESGFDHYDIERSTDGITWTKIGEENLAQRRAGSAFYHFTDEIPYEGKNYYRLKSLEKTGQFTYSKVIAINFKSVEIALEGIVFPNPFNESFSISLSNTSDKANSVRIFNYQGQVIKSFVPSSTKISVATESWSTGVYLVEINTEKGKRILQKVVKN